MRGTNGARWSVATGLAMALVLGCVDDGGGDAPVDASPAIDVAPDRGPIDMQPEPDGEACAEGETRVCDRAPACRGIQRCVDGVFGPCEAAPELCNAFDDDCDDAVDEDFAGVGEACTAGQGACAVEGTVVCTEDERAARCDAVAGEPGVERCDGVDDDCDGVADEGFELASECTVGEGACAVVGLVACAEDGTAVCDAEPAAPVDELCNELDDDCDGAVDEGLGLGDPCTVGQGVCAAEGAVVCGLDEAAVCDAMVGMGGDEACNGLDDDCDGAIDEGFGVGDRCRAGEGACAGTGAIVCGPDGQALCEAQVLEPGPETCNELDDDCDGATDEGFPVGLACARGLGLCAADGVIACADDGDVTCAAEPGAPAAEVCNGADDDCDGTADEGFGLGQACPVGIGACVAEGQIACGEDGAPACVGEPGPPLDEVCNAVDDDCDGTLDEGTGAGEVCGIGIGACAVDGVVVCLADGRQVCEGEVGQPVDELCNDVDDDCDGAVDELFGIGRDCLTEVDGCSTLGRAACAADGSPACVPANAAAQRGDGSDGELVVAAGEVAVLDRPLYALTRLHIEPGGLLTVAPHDPATGLGGIVDLRVTGEAIIEPGAVVDLAGSGHSGGMGSPFVARGYPGAWSNEGGATGWHGSGPGAGFGGFAAPQVTVGSGGGGGHLTPGEAGTPCGADERDLSVWDVNSEQPLPISAPPADFSAGGSVYGEPGRRLSIGSGGGGGANNYDGGPGGVGGPGGAGGGALRISAASLMMDGQIVADGRLGSDGLGGDFVGGGGGGGGGAVHLVAPELRIGGGISAVGGVGGAGTHGSVGGVGGSGWIRLDGPAEVGGLLDPEPMVEAGICLGEAVFEHSGAVERFTVPAGVERIYVEAWGAQGGESESCVDGEDRRADGGLGGYAAAVIPVEAGETLIVRVGGQPTLVPGGVTPGGFNGGGDAGQYGGAGGGATDIRRAGDALADRVVVAGGGGGGNTGCPDHGAGGLGGGLVAGDGAALQGGEPGRGGSQESGGAGGRPDGAQPASAGGLGQGASTPLYHFSGGGGGYYGGGNAYAAGAGGGSSYVGRASLGAVDAGVREGHGRLIIRW